ncbi:MAG: glycine cleavage system aminomethyltransferase GcvT [Thaumarchaeota archaeon]|nr:glycine cleavage system aminomethyltransferase GcvT [Nitrososphaerota archaeon]
MARKSHLYDFHKIHGKMTEFSGFDMPLWYKGIIEEHMAVRTAAGIFDVSHMGRFWIKGKDATRFLAYLLPTNPSPVKNYRAFYTALCNFEGGIVDDVIVNKFSDDSYLMVVNAGNRGKDLDWIEDLSSTFEVSIEDFSNNSALMAIQGPSSFEILQKNCDVDLGVIKRFGFAECRIDGEKALASRTGYTGEDGFEITVFDTSVDRPDRALKVWTRILETGSTLGILPCGLGARDSLRLEAGLCLYGQDIDDTTTPVEAALDNIITKDQRDYIGREKILKQIVTPSTRRRVAFSMSEPGIPRHGFNILLAGQKVGVVTSGTFSPLLKNGIGMGYAPTPISNLGQTISIQIRDQEKHGEIRSTPFYDTRKYGYRRERNG